MALNFYINNSYERKNIKVKNLTLKGAKHFKMTT